MFADILLSLVYFLMLLCLGNAETATRKNAAAQLRINYYHCTTLVHF